MTEPAADDSDEPSPRVVAQRIRNRVIEHLDLAASFEDQLEYERTVPIAYVPYEVIEQWADWVPEDPRTVAGAADVYSADELEAMVGFHRAWAEAVTALPDDYPPFSVVQRLPEWHRMRHAAAAAAAIFARRGRLSEDREDLGG